MQFDTIAQGVRCSTLQDALREAVTQTMVWEDHISRLNENIRTENQQLDDLRRQVNSTGNQEEFALDIRRVEDKIENLEQQLADAENRAREAREQADQLESEMNQEGCNDIAQ